MNGDHRKDYATRKQKRKKLESKWIEIGLIEKQDYEVGFTKCDVLLSSWTLKLLLFLFLST